MSTTAESAADVVAPLVYLAGSSWHDVTGTDRRLVAALVQHRPVLWVDPPRSAMRRRRTTACPEGVPPGVTRITVAAARPFGRALMRRALRREIRRATRPWTGGVDTVVTAAPHGVLADVPARHKVFFATDDLVGERQSKGFSDRARRRSLAADVAAADVVVAVSPGLAARFGAPGRPVTVIPHGCDLPAAAGHDPQPVDLPLRGPLVGLVGELDEGLDIDLLHQLRAAGVPVLVVGPLTARDRGTRQRLLSYLYSDHVHWVGACEGERLRDHLAAMSVGVTPYLPTPFNQRSFPSTTLTYLAAGLPVVTTPLPATAWLDSPFAVQADRRGFVAAVRNFLDSDDAATADRCRAVAARHGWARRAEQFAELCDPGGVRTSV